MDHPFHFRVSHRLAKIVTRIDGRLDRLAFEHARRLRRHLHRVLGLLILLDGKVGALDIALAHLHREVIRAQLGVGGNRVIPICRAHVAELHRLRPHHLVGLRIAHLQAQFLALGHAVARRGLRAHDGLEVHRVAGPIHRTIGVGIAFQTAVGRVAQVPRARRVDGELVGAGSQHGNVLRLGGVDGRVEQALRVGSLRRNFFLIDPHPHQHATDGIAAAAIDHEAHQAAWPGFGDDRNLGDHDDGVSAQTAVGRLDQVDTLVADWHGDGHALPLLMRGDGPLPHRHHLLLVEHRDLREGLDVGTQFLFAAAHLPQADLVARIRRELGADEIANHGPDAMLPGMKLFQPSMRLLRHGRTLAAKVVQLLHLAEEFHRVVHPIDAEFQLSHIVGIDGDFRLLAGKVGTFAGEREIGFGVGVLGEQRQDHRIANESDKDNPGGPHHSPPRKMFQR